MATTAENLSLLQTTKENLKTAIESKGRDLTNVPFTQYPQEVAAIQTGSAENKLAKLIGGQDVELTLNDLRGITELPAQALYQKKNLLSIEIPLEVVTIGNNALAYCTGLTNVTFEQGSKLETIGTYAFQYSSKLASITLPNSVTSIGQQAFSTCTGLKNVTLGNNLTTILSYAFYYCSYLTNITIPSSVTSLGDNAFSFCGQIKKVVFEGQVPNLQTNVFGYCSSIELYDFSNCTSVPTLANVNTLGHKTGCKIVVPDALYDSWQTADIWKDVTNVVWVKKSEYVGG